jgi:hypothetical protein
MREGVTFDAAIKKQFKWNLRLNASTPEGFCQVPPPTYFPQLNISVKHAIHHSGGTREGTIRHWLIAHPGFHQMLRLYPH